MGEAARKSEPGGRFGSQLPADAAISALAARQHAVFDLDQLRGVGLSARAVQKRAAIGRLHRIHHSVYSLTPPSLLTRESFWLAAVLVSGADAVLSHRAAAALHGLRDWGAATVDVTVRGRVNRKRDGVNIHCSTTLTDADVTIVDNIPCTTVARTQLDLADVLDRRGLERSFDQAEILGLFDLRTLHDQLNRNATRRASKIVKTLLEEHYIGSTPTWSELEERFLKLITAGRLTQPEINAWVTLPDGAPAIRADFVWREQKVIVELDGFRTHRTRQSFERDRRRDQRAMAAGWRVVRFTWRQLVREPGMVLGTLKALLQL